MFARNVSVHLKPNSLSQFTQTFENAVLPIMRKQSGYSSQQQQSRAPNLSVQIEQRTHSEIREPVTPIEHAMDIAIGADGKPWVERKRTAEEWNNSTSDSGYQRDQRKLLVVRLGGIVTGDVVRSLIIPQQLLGPR